MARYQHASHMSESAFFVFFCRLVQDAKCRYPSVCSHSYLALPLIPEEEFLAQHPEHNETDPHSLMIARINHEHAEREKLEQARQELLKRKQALIAENKKRKEDLASLDMDLERFIDVSTRFIIRLKRPSASSFAWLHLN